MSFEVVVKCSCDLAVDDRQLPRPLRFFITLSNRITVYGRSSIESLCLKHKSALCRLPMLFRLNLNYIPLNISICLLICLLTCLLICLLICLTGERLWSANNRSALVRSVHLTWFCGWLMRLLIRWIARFFLESSFQLNESRHLGRNFVRYLDSRF